MAQALPLITVAVRCLAEVVPEELQRHESPLLPPWPVADHLRVVLDDANAVPSSSHPQNAAAVLSLYRRLLFLWHAMRPLHPSPRLHGQASGERAGREPDERREAVWVGMPESERNYLGAFLRVMDDELSLAAAVPCIAKPGDCLREAPYSHMYDLALGGNRSSRTSSGRVYVPLDSTHDSPSMRARALHVISGRRIVMGGRHGPSLLDVLIAVLDESFAMGHGAGGLVNTHELETSTAQGMEDDADPSQADLWMSGLALSGLAWSTDKEHLTLVFRCDSLAMLPSGLKRRLADRFEAMGLHSTNPAGSNAWPPHWLAGDAVVDLTFDASSLPCRGTVASGDGNASSQRGGRDAKFPTDGAAQSTPPCAPVALQLRLPAQSPEAAAIGGLWVPDYASEVALVFASDVPVRLEVVIERGSMQHVDPHHSTTTESVAMQPWWCVARQKVRTDPRLNAAAGRDLFDELSDLELLELVEMSIIFGFVHSAPTSRSATRSGDHATHASNATASHSWVPQSLAVRT